MVLRTTRAVNARRWAVNGVTDRHPPRDTAGGPRVGNGPRCSLGIHNALTAHIRIYKLQMAPKKAVPTPTTRSMVQPEAAEGEEEEVPAQEQEEPAQPAQEEEEPEEEEAEETSEGVSRIKMRSVMSLRIHRVCMCSRRYQHAVVPSAS